MPDHIHLLWVGILDARDQRKEAKFFRSQLNPILAELEARFQQQPDDYALREAERERSAFEDVVEYTASNPERARLVSPDKYRAHK
jgi:hypothetical protein